MFTYFTAGMITCMSNFWWGKMIFKIFIFQENIDDFSYFMIGYPVNSQYGVSYDALLSSSTGI